ncbi:N-acetyltransferase [Cryobacterium sp. TMT1-3]|uniref:N-acetyltransferase n=2 Tax=Cryobacterium TaxID=69578 RepID=A0A1H8M1B6_9MICO|nr:MULTISPECIES: GNAT family N-acetyltransferase [Cryobacterium]TFB92249.1 N-acetyltransferase [Cryobacterium luteum]TFC30429.1 N-acetyltransferase [Cryobacterium sp. TMT1-3]SEO11182.1 Protein N-acetyltransferase, RimJ/RimL family [Cryobacterium luteum]
MLFQTEHLSVRQFRRDDLNDFSALCADPNVMRFVGDGTVLSRPEVSQWIEICERKYVDRGYGTSAVFDARSGEFVGYCGVIRAPDRDFDELTYVFHQKAWGNGYATEVGIGMLDHVFRISSLGSISATIEPENEVSKRVAAKLGMIELPFDTEDVSYWRITREQNCAR